MAAQISHKRTTPRCVCSIDPAKHPWEQEKKLHNRWHPDIPHVDTVKEGECFRVETQDWTGGQIKDNDSAEDMKNIDLSLVVSNSCAGVRFPGLIHPGLIGTAPSHELLKIWNDRERKLVEDGEKAVTLGGVLHTRPLANLPEPVGCLLGSMDKNSDEFKKAAKEAARTIPGREHGGNCDIKNLTRGCKVYFPVFIEGANLSMGDMHFSQGDGEVSFCGAIEMCAAFLTLKCTIMRGGMEQYLTPMGPTKLHVNPIFEISPLEPHFSEWLVFEGLSIDEFGRQHYLDASVAYKRAVLNCIHYLAKFGYTKQQASFTYTIYLMLSCCPCEGRISGIVDAPNACCTLAIPTAIFDQIPSVVPDTVRLSCVLGGQVILRLKHDRILR
ncbi:MAG: formamidase [Trebouxia sp. A1-2]|nr:MAG: formamidase [Trebouxia sp. A1-2]